jgi:MFS family permease
MVGVGLAVGPPLGGLIVGHASWRWIFFLNVPIGLLAMQQLLTRIPDDRPAPGRTHLELGAVAAWCLALVGLTVALARGPEAGWASPLVAGAFATCVAAFAAFVVLERRSPAPLLPPSLLFGAVGAGATLTLLGQALSISVGFHLPLYLEDVLGFGASRSGAWLATLPLSALVCAPLAGRWSDRIGSRPLMVFGLVLTAAGLFALSGVGVTPHPVHILGGMALVGVGQGLFGVPNSSQLLSAAPRAQLGLASGLQATMRNLGITSGAAGMAALVATQYAAHGGGAMSALQAGAVNRAAFAAATHDAYLAGGVVALFAALLAARPTRPARAEAA